MLRIPNFDVINLSETLLQPHQFHQTAIVKILRESDVSRFIFEHMSCCIHVRKHRNVVAIFIISQHSWCRLLKSFVAEEQDPLSYTLSLGYRGMRNRYSRQLFTNEDHLCANCASKNNWGIWRQNVSTSCPLDVTDQPWWRHNAKSETTILGDDREMSNRWLF